MGGHTYSLNNSKQTRNLYSKKSADQIFEQIKHRAVHEKMDPRPVKIRECMDSTAHPASFPIIIALDVTGSMKEIPLYYIKTGLAAIIESIIAAGIPDPSILIMAIGDSKCDSGPLQISQFESGDEQLDMWLKRIWPEGGGGGNGGESYLLAYEFAGYRTVTDSFIKRNKKGLLVTIGDEASHSSLSKTELMELYNYNEVNFNENGAITIKDLFDKAFKMYEIYHINIMQGNSSHEGFAYWKKFLGERCIVANDYESTSDIISKLAIQVFNNQVENINLPDFQPISENILL